MRLLATIALLSSLTVLGAQGFSGGFNAGLNFSTINGDPEMDVDGNTLETFENTTGFHIAATFAYAFTDLFGVKAELMYNQMGASKRFEGPSYFYIYTEQGDIYSPAQLRSNQSIVNSYINIPVMAYYRLGPLEIGGGVSAGVLINSISTGSATYTESIYGDNTAINFNIESNFLADLPGAGSILRTQEEPVVQGGPRLPAVIGAYYNGVSEVEQFNRLDFGLVGEINFFLNSGLFLGARYQIGLTDVTDAENDLQKLRVGNGERVNRDDKDYNRSLQASIGFRF
jgi:hypothetical protein